MHCIRAKPDPNKEHISHNGAFTVRPWVYAGFNPADLANSDLAEYCNNKVAFAATGAGSGVIGQLDSQALLSYDNLTVPGGYTDMDIMQIGNSHGHYTLTLAESLAQLAKWSILTSPPVMGNDPRNMSAAITKIITNTEVKP